MSTSPSTLDQRLARQADAIHRDQPRRSTDFELLANLRTWFGADFHLVDGETGDLLRSPPELRGIDFATPGEICRAVAARGRAELIEEEAPLLVLAIPSADADGRSRVAVGAFVSNVAITAPQLLHAAQWLGLPPAEAAAWIARQARWTAGTLASTGQLAAERMTAERHLASLEAEVSIVSSRLAETRREVDLLCRLAQELKLSGNDQKLAQLALEWLGDLVPAESLAIQLTSRARPDTAQWGARRDPVLLTHGRCPVDAEEFTRLVKSLEIGLAEQPLIVNRPATDDVSWPCPAVREAILVPLGGTEHFLGWLAALNHADGGQFGTVEASLLSSVGAILGIHGGNAELYEQQREFFAGMVRALSSAIDAKDPYTRGHSDCVARIAVRLAQELGCDCKQIETVYFAGLLHDVGKIGIDDNVLRKPGKLTDTEYEHIKSHSEIGYKILADVKQLEGVPPIVLHHHERWDGRGYPQGLAGNDIPFLARVVAVADAFDAMASDRPYRRAMPDEMIDSILRDGAGKQWDPAVINAFFRARGDIRRTARERIACETSDVRK